MSELLTPQSNEPSPTSSPLRGSRLGRRFRKGFLYLLLLGFLGVGGLFGYQYVQFYRQRSTILELVDKHRFFEAMPLLAQAMEKNPNDSRTLFLAAKTARNIGRFEEANLFLREYEKRKGADNDYIRERVLLLADRGEIDSVADLIMERIDQEDPYTPEYLEAITRGCLRTYRTFEARYWMNIWSKRYPDDIQLWLQRGWLADLSDNVANSTEEYLRVLEKEPDHDYARTQLVRILLGAKRATEAIPHLEQLRKTQDRPDIDLQYAMALDQTGRSEEASVVFDAVLEKDPNNPTALSERGRLALNAEQWTKAEELLKRSLQFEPGNSNTRYQLVKALRELGKLVEVKEQEERIERIRSDMARMGEIVRGAMQQRPNDPSLHCEVGMISLRSGQPQEAMRWFQKALMINPNYPTAHEGLLYYHQLMGNIGMASFHRGQMRRGQELMPNVAPLGDKLPKSGEPKEPVPKKP